MPDDQSAISLRSKLTQKESVGKSTIVASSVEARRKQRRKDVYHDSDIDTPDVLSEISSEGEEQLSKILLTE